MVAKIAIYIYYPTIFFKKRTIICHLFENQPAILSTAYFVNKACLKIADKKKLRCLNPSEFSVFLLIISNDSGRL
jgi:hypothetical protein